MSGTNYLNDDKMETFLILIRIDPNLLTAENTSLLQQQWEPVIKHWMQRNTLVNAWIIRESGYTISGVSETVVSKGYQLDKGMAITGTMLIKAINMDAALEEAKLCPTPLFGGVIELRKVNSFN